MINVRRLNHAVLFVADPARSAAFYQEVLGFEEVERMGNAAVFMRAAGSDNHHDLAVMRAGSPGGAPGGVGLYHLAWQVDTIEELAQAAVALAEQGALVGMSDHGVSKSVYARDPDGIEFEVMFAVPREAWGEYEKKGVVQPLDLRRELARFGSQAASAS